MYKLIVSPCTIPCKSTGPGLLMGNLLVTQDCVPDASDTIVYESDCTILMGGQQELTFRIVVK